MYSNYGAVSYNNNAASARSQCRHGKPQNLSGYFFKNNYIPLGVPHIYRSWDFPYNAWDFPYRVKAMSIGKSKTLMIS